VVVLLMLAFWGGGLVLFLFGENLPSTLLHGTDYLILFFCGEGGGGCEMGGWSFEMGGRLRNVRVSFLFFFFFFS
jgi:hypothetical protein